MGGKEFERSTDVYGIQFLDPEGNEVGGLGVEDSHNTRMLCFDYATAEALCLANSDTFVGMNIIGSPKPGASVGKPGPERISMGVTYEGNSFLKLSDNNGKERIAFTIDAENIVRIKVLDENGIPIFQIPEKK